MSQLFTYDYTIDAGNEFYLHNILTIETYERMFSKKYVSFLNKGECGNGGTTGFVRYALEHNRGCLILVPNVSIVVSKMNEYEDNKNVCCVYGGTDNIDPEAMIVIATYDQFERLLKTLSQFAFARTEDIWAAPFWVGRTIIIDEYHKLVDECGFRDKICPRVTNLIQKTDSGVILMSATPHWGYVDMVRQLVGNRDVITYNVDYNNEYKKLIQVYEVKQKDLKSILHKVKEHNEQTCVFYNNVGGIKKIIDHIGGDDCEVLCSSSNDKELGNYYSNAFNESKRIHFMTSAYFTGQDINTYVKQCIIIGSPEAENMCLGERDIKQIIGRFRKGVAGIQLFYVAKKVNKSNYQTIMNDYESCKDILAMGDNWGANHHTIGIKQDTIRLKDTLERFDYWASKKKLISRLEDFGYIVKLKQVGDYDEVVNRKKLSFHKAKKRIAAGTHVTYDEYKYGVQIKEYMDAKGCDDMLAASRSTILNWHRIRKTVGITDIDSLTPAETFKVLGLQHFGMYRGGYLLDCLKYLGVSCDYSNLTIKMREHLDCYAFLSKRDKKGKPAGDIYTVFVEQADWGLSKPVGSNISPCVDWSHRISYQTNIKDGHCYGQSVLLKDAPNRFKSLAGIKLYDWVNEDKEHRLADVKKGDEWTKIKNFKQTKISEMFKDTDKEYRHNKSSVEYADCLIIDVDGGITFNQFKEMYGDYGWAAYPTINNIGEDWTKFRVIVPLANRIKLVGEYNLQTLKALRTIFCYYEDQQHQMCSYVNLQDWQKFKVNEGVIYEVKQSLVDDIMLSVKNSKDCVMMRFDANKVSQDLCSFKKGARDLEWAMDYFQSSFSLGDGMRHHSLFIIKNSLDAMDRDRFESWLMSAYPHYITNWKSHKVK